MKVNTTLIPGVYIIEVPIFTDERGSFTKILQDDLLTAQGLHVTTKESFYSISKEGVIRGMHFQTPPEDHEKLVYCPSGAIMDVVLDMRKNSPTFGQHLSVELSPENGKAVFIPKGCAHGFLSLKDQSVTVYHQSTIRSPEHESGVKYDSFGMDWGINAPIISIRDQKFSPFDHIISPFL